MEATMKRGAVAGETVALPCACPQCGVHFTACGAPGGVLAPIGRRTLAAALAVRSGPQMAATARQVALALGITPSAATTNLLRAVAAGILRAERERGGPHGGVRNVYRVAPLLAAYAPEGNGR